MLKGYSIKLEKALVPMARGSTSSKVLKMAFDLSKSFSTEITAFTVRDVRRELTWTDKVNLITDAYRLGRELNVRVVPKIVSSESTKESIVNEVNSHRYDVIIMATTRRSPLSASLFGNMGDYVFKHSKAAVAMLSIKTPAYPYRSIIVPVSEELNHRFSVAFSLHLKRALNRRMSILDLRKYDKKPTHRFKSLFDSFTWLVDTYGDDISLNRTGYRNGLLIDLAGMSDAGANDLMVLGIAVSPSGSLRINSKVKYLVKHFPGDVIVIKRG